MFTASSLVEPVDQSIFRPTNTESGRSHLPIVEHQESPGELLKYIC